MSKEHTRPPAVGRPETIMHAGKPLCIIVRGEPVPKNTTFYTPHDVDLQCGKVVYAAESVCPRHRHLGDPHVVASAVEILTVQEGRMIIDLYSDQEELLCSREIARGDVVIQLSGGHGFHFLEHTVLLEVKQGPYRGSEDKILF